MHALRQVLSPLLCPGKGAHPLTSAFLPRGGRNHKGPVDCRRRLRRPGHKVEPRQGLELLLLDLPGMRLHRQPPLLMLLRYVHIHRLPLRRCPRPLLRLLRQRLHPLHPDGQHDGRVQLHGHRLAVERLLVQRPLLLELLHGTPSGHEDGGLQPQARQLPRQRHRARLLPLVQSGGGLLPQGG